MQCHGAKDATTLIGLLPDIHFLQTQERRKGGYCRVETCSLKFAARCHAEAYPCSWEVIAQPSVLSC